MHLLSEMQRWWGLGQGKQQFSLATQALRLRVLCSGGRSQRGKARTARQPLLCWGLLAPCVLHPLQVGFFSYQVESKPGPRQKRDKLVGGSDGSAWAQAALQTLLLFTWVQQDSVCSGTTFPLPDLQVMAAGSGSPLLRLLKSIFPVDLSEAGLE